MMALTLPMPATAPWLPSRFWRSRSLTSKLTIVLMVVGLASLAIGGYGIAAAVRPAFDTLERQQVDRQIAQSQSFLARLGARVEAAALDYANWDATYAFMESLGADYRDENFTDGSFADLQVNGMALVRFDGAIVASHFVDLETEAAAPDWLPHFEEAAAADTIRAFGRESPSFNTFVQMEDRIFALAVAQIRPSGKSGEPRGLLVMAREVTSDATTEALQTPVSVRPRHHGDKVIALREADSWRVRVPVLNHAGAAIATLDFRLDRDVSRLGNTTLRAALGASFAIMLGSLLAVYGYVRLGIGRRLGVIDGHMQRVADTGQLTPLPADGNTDEIGSLAFSFNRMTAELKDLKEQVQAQAYRLGRSDWASAVMHNVRNALNPVTVILSKAAAERSAVDADAIGRALGELASPDTPAERRGKLTAFLLAAFDDNERRAGARRQDLMSARALLGESLGILSSEEAVAHEAFPIEPVDILEVVARNAAFARFVPWGSVEVVVPSEAAWVDANPVLLSQVIGNLMTNAVEAIVAAGRRPGRIEVGVETLSGAEVAIRICDDGRGFQPAEATQFFARGKSSKGAGGGLGLHWCANAINAMRGSLTLSSEGPGRGACARLVLPAARQPH
jgi:signal transduction histidine kinase